MLNFSDSIKEGLGRHIGRFHAQMLCDTPGVREWAGRPLAKAAAFAPGRMVDEAEKMLEAWRKNDTPKPLLPMLLVAVAKDFMPTPAEFTRNNGDLVSVMIPGDPLERVFKLRTVSRQLRAQMLIAAADEPTASSLAAQLYAFIGSMENRSFPATFRLAGFKDDGWPIQIETAEVPMPAATTEQVNLTMLLADLTLYATIPMLFAPKSTEPNDGKGSGPNQDDPFAENYVPSGYRVVTQADFVHGSGSQDGGATVDWSVRG